jgi:hypothetical protein
LELRSFFDNDGIFKLQIKTGVVAEVLLITKVTGLGMKQFNPAPETQTFST